MSDRGCEVTILGPAESDMEPVTWPEKTLGNAIAAAEGAMAEPGEYDHGEVRDLQSGEVRYFYREYRIVWEDE